MLDKIEALTDVVKDGFKNAAAIAVESGEVINDDADESADVVDIDAIDLIPDLNELDLSLDEIEE